MAVGAPAVAVRAFHPPGMAGPGIPGRKIEGRAMNTYQPGNPYAPTLANTAQRLRAWVRGVIRLHRRTIVVLLAAGVTLAAGVSAGEAPVHRIAAEPR